MEKNIAFYKENTLWYADIKEHTKTENMMVKGSGELLEFIYRVLGKSNNHLTFHISDEHIYWYEFRLKRTSHNGTGAYYIVDGPSADKFKVTGHKCWLGNVSHTVFKEHPKEIFVNSIG